VEGCTGLTARDAQSGSPARPRRRPGRGRALRGSC